jgi:Ca2+-binding EF-hand superfamily protein
MKTLLTAALLLLPTLAAAEPPSASDEATAAFAAMDSDRDGQLSLKEFEKGVAPARGANRPGVVYQRLPARFRALDRDGSGYLEAGEFSAEALARFDFDNDGRLDFREFAAMHAPASDAQPVSDEQAIVDPPGGLGKMRSSRSRQAAPIRRTG